MTDPSKLAASSVSPGMFLRSHVSLKLYSGRACLIALDWPARVP